MFAIHEQYLINEKGQKKAVVLPVSEWKKVLEILEEYEDIRAYDQAKAKKSDPVSFKKIAAKLKHG
ncbi:MAG TPA: hypothetical protein VGU44_01480 [Gammaproteobacteria bacterium]|nr:hypothetical protein [Gammaproteobacteria bacterium]HEV2613585.1 hypothetical protein [Gammaproteobacteria bacterium]